MPGASVVRELRASSDRRQLVVLLWATIVPPALLSLEDAIAGRDLTAALLRSVPAVVAALALVGVATTPSDVSVRERSHIVVFAVAVALLASAAARPESDLAPLRGRLLGPALFYLLAPNSMARQATPPLLLSAGYVVLRGFRLQPFEPPAFANDVVFLVVLNIAGLLRMRSRLLLEASLERAWERENDARLAAEQARAEVRTLVGIIPICMHCRKLRSDMTGWQRLESYVREHTGAQFSHGICPECLEIHYPEPPDEPAAGSGDPVLPRE